MKLYISPNQPPSAQHSHIANIMSIDSTCLDSEATEIIVEDFLCQFTDNELIPLLQKILSKLRLNGTITLIDNDIDITYMKYDRGDIDLKGLNDILFKGMYKKSFLNIDSVIELIKNDFKIEQASLDSDTGNFIVKARRVANA